LKFFRKFYSIMKKSPKKRNSKKTEADLLIKYLEEQLKEDIESAAWSKKRLVGLNARIAQNRKILEKLKII